MTPLTRLKNLYELRRDENPIEDITVLEDMEYLSLIHIFARELLDIPLYKIDEPMADQAVESGNNILVLGTVKSTLEPTSDLIRSKRKSQEQSVTCILIPDVFELYEIDRERHDQKIAEVIQEHWNTCLLYTSRCV